MNKKDTIETLQKDIEIPMVVQNKIDGTLLKIEDEAKQSSKVVAYDGKTAKSTTKRTKRRFGMIAAIAALVVTTVSVGAAVYMNWSKGLEETLHVQEEQKAKLEENKTTTFMEQTSTDQGITVTATQSITDNYYTYIAFKVEGFDVAEGEEPFFENTIATVAGAQNDEIKAIGTFYDGIVSDSKGNLIYEDGSPINNDENGTIFSKYQREDGSLEYHLTIYSMEGKGHLRNKKVHIELNNLGNIEKAEYANKVTGKWSFDIDLQGSDEVKEAVVEVPLGDTGAIVVGAEISPISIGATYKVPSQTETEEMSEDTAKEIALAAGIEVEEVETTIEVSIDPPRLMGVKMKDGTLYPFIYMGPGGDGYLDENADIRYTRFAIDRILDVDQVEALLFEKSYSGEGEPTENDFYVVPIN